MRDDPFFEGTPRKTLDMEGESLEFPILYYDFRMISSTFSAKIEVSEKVVSNVKEQIVPCIEELKKGPLTSKQKATLALLESNLTNIISPFTHRSTFGIFNLTPKEIRVANLIR